MFLSRIILWTISLLSLTQFYTFSVFGIPILLLLLRPKFGYGGTQNLGILTLLGLHKGWWSEHFLTRNDWDESSPGDELGLRPSCECHKPSLKRPPHGKLKLANSSWQTQVGVCVNGTKTGRKHVCKLLAPNRNVFADCFYAVHTHQLEFANLSLPCEGRLREVNVTTGSQPEVSTKERKQVNQ